MLPAVASRYNTALTVMQTITSWQEQQAVKDQKKNQPAGAAAFLSPAPTSTSRTKEAINALFSVNYVTKTQLMIRIVDKVAGYLNDKLASNADQSGDNADIAAEKSDWRSNAVAVPSQDTAASGNLSIPKPGDDSDGGLSFGQVAQKILNTFKNDYLSGDLQLKKQLEDMIGFSLDGVSVVDLLQAAVDPESDAGKKVDNMLSDGLAGQKGSKVSQRLERAAKGPRSVDEAVGDALNKSPIDEVDDDTLAEDRQAIANAVAQDKLEKVQSMQERVTKISKDAAKPGAKSETVDDKVQQASDVVAALATESGTSPSDASAPDKPASDKLGADKAGADPSGDAAAASVAGASGGVAAAARERKTDAVIEAQDAALEKTVRAAHAETADKPIVRGYREAEEIGAHDDDRRHSRSLAV